MTSPMRHLAAFALVALIAAACGASDDSTDGGRPPSLTGAATAGVGAVATLEGERFVAVRALPASALSAEKLESAGEAQSASGETIAMARARDARVAPWELVSATPDGWLVWRPAIILDALAGAGADAALVEAEAVLWPDACLDAAEPGEICAQVVTPGYRIIIERGGQPTEYHTDLRGNVRTLSP
jgi:hypothetical protein